MLQLHPHGFAALALDLGVPGRQKPLLRDLLCHIALATPLGPSRDDRAVSPRTKARQSTPALSPGQWT